MRQELTRLGFEASYSVERLDGRPRGSVREFRQPRHGAEAGELVLETGSEYLWFAVTPADGESWVGGFECGPGRLTGLFAAPSPEVVCVVAKGQGFWVPVLAPADYEIIRSIPIQEVLAVPGKRILVFIDYTELEAYGPGGFLWRTERLSWDGLKVTEVTAEMIRGTAWDSPANREVPFSVDTENGASEGGSSPAKYGAGRARGTT
jgi:hypothetical protein